jgi:hypothetical protein
MNFTNENTLREFITSFKKQIEIFDPILINKLKSLNERKYFFKNHLFPRIAEELNLRYEETKEFLRVDYTFFKEGNLHKWHVPIIFIESENSWQSSYEEALKLCSLNAPLKVLIHYGLNEEINKEIEGKETNWDYIFNDFINETKLIGYFLLLVYINQTDTEINFKKIVYNEEGKTIESSDLVVRIRNNKLP